MIREELLALADELEGMDCREGCRTCPADGTKDCRVDLPCEEAVACAAARRIREIAEHDACEEAATTVSAYDLLPDEDREAIAFVREHGGLGAVEKRPAPKVLDADGVEIRVGDVLYSIETGDSVIVDSIEPGNPWFVKTDGELQHCAKFTHRAPVIAADGKPLEVGQTVWRDDGEMLEVLYLRLDGLVDCCGEIERPERLTHERPDSWERLEHDAEKTVCEYFGANYDCANCPLEPDRCDEEAKKDIIRRAKKLAERGGR